MNSQKTIIILKKAKQVIIITILAFNTGYKYAVKGAHLHTHKSSIEAGELYNRLLNRGFVEKW